MLRTTGVPTKEQIDSIFPSDERLKEGAVAIIECYQNIPCNPCYTACHFDAIKKFDDINDLPELFDEKCGGCGMCLAKCPGLAIMVVDATYSETHAMMKIPYEFLPLPVEGELAMGLDREGKEVDHVKIVKVQNNKTLDRTPIIWFQLKKEYIKTIRNIKVV